MAGVERGVFVLIGRCRLVPVVVEVASMVY